MNFDEKVIEVTFQSRWVGGGGNVFCVHMLSFVMMLFPLATKSPMPAAISILAEYGKLNFSKLHVPPH